MTSWLSNFTLLLSTQAKKFPSIGSGFSAFRKYESVTAASRNISEIQPRVKHRILM